MAINLSDLLPKPLELEISSGLIFLFPITRTDIESYSSISNEPDGNRLKAFLPIFVSLSRTNDIESDRVGISLDHVRIISDEELDNLAQKYLESTFLKIHFDSILSKIDAKNESQSFATYFDLVLYGISKQHDESIIERNKKLLDAMKSPYFDSARDASRMVSDSMQSIITLQQNQHNKLRNERKEELEIARMTRDMSIQTSLMLQELTKAAERMLVDLDNRSRKADEGTRKALKIGKYSLYAAVFFSGLALCVSLKSYTQDQINNESNDEWQRKLLNTITESKIEFNASNNKILELENKIKSLQAEKNSSLKKNKQ